MKARKLKESLLKALMLLSLLLVLSLIFIIITLVAIKGISSINLSMILESPKGGYYLGKEGGIANAIIGSLYLVSGSTAFALLISIPIALGLQKEYASKRLSDITRLVLYILWGTPSIVYGIFGFIIMIYFGLRASLLGGIIVLTLLMIPIMVRAMDEAICMVPFELKEISYALGTTKFETTLAVIFKQAMPGICTAVILAFGRGMGDAASVLFTAGYTDSIPTSFLDPVASLPLAVFFQIGTPIPEVQARAYAAALILILIVIVVNIITRIFSRNLSKHIVK